MDGRAASVCFRVAQSSVRTGEGMASCDIASTVQQDYFISPHSLTVQYRARIYCGLICRFTAKLAGVVAEKNLDNLSETAR